MEFEKRDLSKILLDSRDGGRKEEYVADEPEEKNPLIACCKKLDNKAVLMIVCCLFAFFASAEMIGAVYADSLSLLGDSTSSLVDVLTYASNYYAEYLVTPINIATDEENGTEHSKKKLVPHIKLDARTKLIHEVYVPTFSLVTLFAVTLFIFSMSVIEISKGGDDDTDPNIMFAFASVNTCVDITCFTMFYFRKDDFLHHRFPSVVSVSEESGDSGSPTPKPPVPLLRNANINMFSALTHVSCDALRTTAIFIAAITSTTSGEKSSLCDAWAAIIVSITIVFAMIPLALEVYAAFTGKR